MENDFAREFRVQSDDLQSDQIIVMLDQDETDGSPVIKFHLFPKRFGVCHFIIGNFQGDEEMSEEEKAGRMFSSITQEQVEEAVKSVIAKINEQVE